MLKIRKGTFESNSSSMHTLVRVGNKDKIKVLQDRYKGANFLHVPDKAKYYRYKENDGYSWGPYVLTTPLDKATYLVSYFARYGDAESTDEIDHYDEILREVQKTHPDFQGWKPYNKPNHDDWYYETFGFIDHQSADILDDLELDEILKTINDPLVVYLIISDAYYLPDELAEDEILGKDGEVIAPNWGF